MEKRKRKRGRDNPRDEVPSSCDGREKPPAKDEFLDARLKGEAGQKERDPEKRRSRGKCRKARLSPIAASQPDCRNRQTHHRNADGQAAQELSQPAGPGKPQGLQSATLDVMGPCVGCRGHGRERQQEEKAEGGRGQRIALGIDQAPMLHEEVDWNARKTDQQDAYDRGKPNERQPSSMRARIVNHVRHAVLFL